MRPSCQATPTSPAGVKDIVQRFAGARAITGAVEKDHIGSLRHGGLHPLPTPIDVLAGKTAVPLQHLQQLARPRFALPGIGADEGVHAQHVHLVVMRRCTVRRDAVAQVIAVNDVIAADEAARLNVFEGA